MIRLIGIDMAWGAACPLIDGRHQCSIQQQNAESKSVLQGLAHFSLELAGYRFANLVNSQKFEGFENARVATELGGEVRLGKNSALRWVVAGGEASTGAGSSTTDGKSDAAMRFNIDVFSRLELNITRYLSLYAQGGLRMMGTGLVGEVPSSISDPNLQSDLEAASRVSKPYSTVYGQSGLYFRF